MQNVIKLISRPDETFPSNISLLCLQSEKLMHPIDLMKNPNLIVVKVNYLSIDPVMRVWMSGAQTYLPPLELNQTMYAFGVGEVIYSKSERFKKGDIVTGILGMQEYCLIDLKLNTNLLKIIPILLPEIPLHYYLNVMGINGLTAYMGLIEIGKAKKGDTVVVSTAAGATGILVCQFAKMIGCRVIGITGSDDKCKIMLEEIKIDDCINYNKEKDLKIALGKRCKKTGIDIYFDNVGEDVLDAALIYMNNYGRIALSGAIKTYIDFKGRKGIANYQVIISKRLIMRGFTFDETFKKIGEAIQFIYNGLTEKKIILKEEILDGLKFAPYGLQKVFKGENIGKIIIKLDSKNENLNSKL